MTIATFYEDLKDNIGRGNSVDGKLGRWVRAALETVETEYSWLFNETSATLTLDPGDSNVVTLPVAKVKAVLWAQQVQTQPDTQVLFGATLRGLTGPKDFLSIDLGRPSGFYLQGENQLVLDAKPAPGDTFDLFVQFVQFTVWDDTNTALTPPWLANRQAWLEAETMMVAAARLRDDRLASIWGGVAGRLRVAALEADKEKRWAHQNRMAQARD